MECYLGIREKFVYKKKSATSAEYTTIFNLTMIDSYFPAHEPQIPGFTYIMGIGTIFVSIITVIVFYRFKKGKIK
ncbi:MAG: hypothetical protein ACTSRE_16045 [Promethearchaeota archaeon]